MKRVTVVEDNPDNSMLVEAMLEDHFEMTLYPDGPSALAGMVDHLPDCVLMDISLPGMDGVEALAEMKKQDSLKNIPVIALTAHAMTGDREKYLNLGFDQYFTKPIVDDEALIALVHSVIGAQG